jgi:DNA repair protein RadC
VLKNIPLDSQPREKLLALGPGALANSELIALLLRTGFKGTSVLQLAERLLQHFQGLSGLLKAHPDELKKIKGLGPAKRAEMTAVLELARRSLHQDLAVTSVFESPTQVQHFLQMQLGTLAHEVFGVLFLDAKNRLLSWQEMFRGSLTHTAVYPREIVKQALALQAASVVLAHNHPSGCPEPSAADMLVTDRVCQALMLMDIRVLDHWVIGRNGVVSFAQRGLM